MTDLVILGTDTDVGKTTFALLWLAAFAERYEYWKPIGTGDSDSQRVRELVPAAEVHPALKHFAQAVAPPLAAELADDVIPSAKDIVAATPRLYHAGRHLLVETFGSPYSPLNRGQLQIELIKVWRRSCVLISSTTLGAIGRTLQCQRALAADDVSLAAIVLLGPADPFAERTLAEHSSGKVFHLAPP